MSDLDQLTRDIGTQTDRSTARELANDVRKLLKHESTIVSQRIGWLSAFEGLLFAAFGSLATKDASSLSNLEPLKVICYAGISVAIISLLGLFASAIATNRLLKWWEINRSAAYDGPGVIGWALPAQPWASYLTAWNLLPVIIGTAWIVLLVSLPSQH
ncbi:hypothetical protein [Ralstonia syzygii]|uniref:Transmembrane protein n=1 Tax=Ralstonia syzygii R24 TaxID=907261 RepID=G3A2B0_9RALS|nr:hypothetical protein [Ralstonia syzygii]CCA85542.1 hypothetical protein RALSY_20145 [Ralstonia syzygii R24]